VAKRFSIPSQETIRQYIVIVGSAKFGELGANPVTANRSLLIVEDDPLQCELLAEAFGTDFTVRAAGTLGEADKL
jgi:hypothetical protein